MNNNIELKTKKEQLILQNKELKVQIENIKNKIEEIRSKKIPKIPEKLASRFILNDNYNDTEMFEIRKKIDYYIEEISKKKFQIDNLVSLTQINNLKDKLKKENEKIENLQNEKYSLISVYNNQVKSINKSSMKYDLTTQDNLIEKISKKKNEFKEIQKKYKNFDEKLKEQRLNYMNLNDTINKIKNKIQILKKKEKIEKNKINYGEEIAKIENEIQEEQNYIIQEENFYKEIMVKNEKIINELTEDIIKKREKLKDKGNVKLF